MVRFIAFCAAAILAACRVSAPSPQVLVFSDLHFNPLSDPAQVAALQRADVADWPSILAGSAPAVPSTYGTDTNYPLLESALAAMQQTVPGPDLVLIAGDFLAHGFQSNFRKAAPDAGAPALAAFIDKTNQFLARRIGEAFPRAQILPALGNNDSACGDYMSEPASPFLRAFADAWRPLVERGDSSSGFAATFAAAGNYSVMAPAIGARVIVPNDVYWSTHYSNACGSPSAPDPGSETLAWLKGELAASRSRDEPVWLLSHAPFGIDVFATVHGSAVESMLQPQYDADLIALLREFSSTVSYGIYGHTHMMEFRAFGSGATGPLLAHQGIPAVSPLFGNNPAFVVLTLDAASRAIIDYAVHTLTNGSWSKEYSFREAYGGEPFSEAALARLFGTLNANPDARNNYARFYDSGSGRASPTPATWRAYWCGIGNADASSFTRCMSSASSAQ
jgi:sphingomyelin phosphodiesterase acid-like 3